MKCKIQYSVQHGTHQALHVHDELFVAASLRLADSTMHLRLKD